mgnify:CR=1 FL=1
MADRGVKRRRVTGGAAAAGGDPAEDVNAEAQGTPGDAEFAGIADSDVNAEIAHEEEFEEDMEELDAEQADEGEPTADLSAAYVAALLLM